MPKTKVSNAKKVRSIVKDFKEFTATPKDKLHPPLYHSETILYILPPKDSLMKLGGRLRCEVRQDESSYKVLIFLLRHDAEHIRQDQYVKCDMLMMMRSNNVVNGSTIAERHTCVLGQVTL